MSVITLRLNMFAYNLIIFSAWSGPFPIKPFRRLDMLYVTQLRWDNRMFPGADNACYAEELITIIGQVEQID